MKAINIALSLIAAAALFAGCQGTAADTDIPQISTEKGVYDAPQTGGEIVVKFISSTDWTAKAVPASSLDKIDDVTVSPESGSGSSEPQVIKVKFGANAGYDRAAILQILGDGLSAAVTISQPGAQGEFIEQITCAEFLKKPVDASVWYILEGAITKIAKGSSAEDKYNNFYINDGSITDGDGAYIYGLYDGKGGAQFDTAPAWLYSQGITVGYTIRVVTTRGQYGNTIEGVNTYVLSYAAPTIPMISCSNPTVSVKANETSAKFSIKVLNLTEKWSVAATDADWVTSFTQEGTEDGDIEVTFPANTVTEARSATFTVTSAGASPLVLTLTQAAFETPVFEEPFDENQGDFTIDNKVMDDPLTFVWQWNSYKYMKATAYKSNTSYPSESWLISPEVDLAEVAAPTLKFQFAINYGAKNKDKYNEAFYLVVTEGTNETVSNFSHMPDTGSWEWYNEEVDLSAWSGKKIKFAFVYKSTADNAPTVEVKEVKILK
ncbi:MAG: BACON domain-containing protein [Bacteroidales bacterium]|nr:BACON domain-containing protein [Bacteroidales bacterium]